METEARKSLLDAWRQVTEVMFCCTPTDILGNSQRQQILLELLQTLLNKVLTEGASTELTSPVSGIVLLLMTALRQTYRQEGVSGDGGTPSDDTRSRHQTQSCSICFLNGSLMTCLVYRTPFWTHEH